MKDNALTKLQAVSSSYSKFWKLLQHISYTLQTIEMLNNLNNLTGESRTIEELARRVKIEELKRVTKTK